MKPTEFDSIKDMFVACWDVVSLAVCQNSIEKGFHGTPDQDHPAIKIALMHSELSEALEAMRVPNQESEKIDGFTQVEEELADVVIRIMDYAEYERLDVAGAILAKIRYNKGRPHKHGGKKF